MKENTKRFENRYLKVGDFLTATKELLGEEVAGQMADYLYQTYEGKEKEAVIGEVLSELGMPSNLRGYRHIIEAVKLIMQDPELGNHVTQKVYPAIKMEGQPEFSVERAITYAIEKAWYGSHGEAKNELETKIFGRSYDAPTNSKFLSRLAMYIKQNRL